MHLPLHDVASGVACVSKHVTSRVASSRFLHDVSASFEVSPFVPCNMITSISFIFQLLLSVHTALSLLGGGPAWRSCIPFGVRCR